MATSYASLIGLKTSDPLKVAERVHAGLAYASLEHLQQAVDLPLAQVAELVHIPARTLARRKASGRLDPDESDRLVRISRVIAAAITLFEGDHASARRWLTAPRTALRNRAPLDLAQTDVGAREVERLIGQLEHGILP